jgi:hypothetical protein
MKKILFLISTIFLLTACSSDDDVLSEKDAQLELDQIEQQVKLKSAADKQHRVAAYEAKQEKFVITLSDDTEVMLPNTSSFFTIGEDGNWWIDGTKTEIEAKAESKITFNPNGDWLIDGKATGVALKGDKKKNDLEIVAIILKENSMVFLFADGSNIDLETNAPEIVLITPVEGFEVDMMQWLRLSPEVKNGDESSFEWTMNEEIISNTNELLHVFSEDGTYNIKFAAENNMGVATKELSIIVNKQTYNNKIAKVHEFLPAPGQFVNKMPAATAEDNAESMVAKANKILTDGGMVSLGGFGGYVTFGFDHTVINKEGNDFVVLGNAMINSAEPGVIMVSYDANGNGLPDDEWFEIEGSQHPKEGTIKEYEMTYYRPTEEPADANEPAYIRWTDNKGQEGYIAKNSFHRQSYYPMWAGESITYKGTYLAAAMYDESGNGTMWKSPAYDFGYADNWANNDEKGHIDIDWAVDKDGNKVNLKGIDFVRVHTSTRAAGGWLGEVSTEVSGFKDLNLE